MSHNRSFTANFFAGVRKGRYSGAELKRKSLENIKLDWLTNIFNNYPPLLPKEDITDLANRYEDILRRIPSNQINHYELQGCVDIKHDFRRLCTDIVRIGSAALLDYRSVVRLDIKSCPQALHDLIDDIVHAVCQQLSPEQPVIPYKVLDCHSAARAEQLINAIADRAKSQRDEDYLFTDSDLQTMSHDIRQLAETVLFPQKEQVEKLGFFIEGRNSIAHLVKEIAECAQPTYAIRQVDLRREFFVFLGLNQNEESPRFKGRADEVMISYLGSVFNDILLNSKKVIAQYPEANKTMTNLLNKEKKEYVLSGMTSPDFHLDISDSSATIAKVLNYPKEHTQETLTVAVPTLFLGVFGLAAGLAYNYLAKDDEAFLPRPH